MQQIAKHFFDRVRDAKVQDYPFEHLVIDNLLPDSFYKNLAAQIASEDFHNNYQRGAYGNIERYAVDLTDYGAFRASSAPVSATKLHPFNYNKLLERNQIYIDAFVRMLIDNHSDFYSLLSSRLPTERTQDNYFFHINMTKDSVGYEIGAHCDDEQNIFTILFYTPETDENREFGLHVCKERVDFMPNRMVVFAPSKPNTRRAATWHEVKRLSSNLVGTRNSFQMFFCKKVR